MVTIAKYLQAGLESQLQQEASRVNRRGSWVWSSFVPGPGIVSQATIAIVLSRISSDASFSKRVKSEY